MSLNAHGVICYGIRFPGDYNEFPWIDVPDQVWWEAAGGEGECPLEMYFCGDKEWTNIIFLKDTLIDASENYPESFDTNHFKLDISLIDICERFGIEIIESPKWWLIAGVW